MGQTLHTIQQLGDIVAWQAQRIAHLTRHRDDLHVTTNAYRARYQTAEAILALLAKCRTEGWVRMEIDYTNYKGERGTRIVEFTGVVVAGDPTYHPGAPYVLKAFDPDKKDYRTFDPKHIHSWKVLPR